jgi:hypothetical protein
MAREKVISPLQKAGPKEALMKIYEMTIGNPSALVTELFSEPGQSSYYDYVDKSSEAVKIRKEAKKMLADIWGGGCYNYQQLADALRVSTLSIQGLIDQDFIEEKMHGKG